MRPRSSVLLAALAPLLAAAPAAAQTPVLILDGSGQPPGFGADARGVGDWDGDGVGDIAVGIIADGNSTGSVRIHSGRDGSLLATFSGTVAKQQFGALVAGVGDADADGAVDLAVGSKPYIGTVPTSVQVFSGATHALIFERSIPSFGLFDLAATGDVNGDGFDDVVKGGFACASGLGTSDAGDATVYSGTTGDVLHKWCGDGPGDDFGLHVAHVGDVNLDGYADVLVGAREGNDYSPGGTGYVRILSGLDGSTLFTFEGPPIDSNGFGEAIDGAGDVNGDGWPDIVVGARQEKVNGVFMGSASVYSGHDGSLLHHVLGTLVYKQFGIEVAGPGDVNGDGLADFAVTTDQLDMPGPPQTGYVIHSGADASVLHEVPLQPAESFLYVGLRAVGDLNADGLPDLLVRFEEPDAPVPGAATVRVLSGAPALFADLGFALPGSQGTPQLQVEGVLAHGLPLTLSISSAPKFAPLLLVIGGAATPAPFHGGVLVPAPQVVLAGLVTNAAGALTLGTSFPSVPPAGLTVVLQGWLPDAAAPTHFAATNAVEGLAP